MRNEVISFAPILIVAHYTYINIWIYMCSRIANLSADSVRDRERRGLTEICVVACCTHMCGVDDYSLSHSLQN